MTASTAQLRAGLDRATAQNRRFARTNQGIFGRLSASLGGLRTVFAGLFAGAGIAGAARLADTFTSVNNLLRASGVSAADLAATFAQVQTVATATRSELDATGRLFAVLTRNSANLGASQTEILLATQAVQQAFAITGASAQEAAGATRQLAQALASGVLRGQELNSILEQGAPIAPANPIANVVDLAAAAPYAPVNTVVLVISAPAALRPAVSGRIPLPIARIKDVVNTATPAVASNGIAGPRTLMILAKA